MIGAAETTIETIAEERRQGQDHLWVIPSVVLAGLSTKQSEALTAKLHTLRPLLEPEPDDP